MDILKVGTVNSRCGTDNISTNIIVFAYKILATRQHSTWEHNVCFTFEIKAIQLVGQMEIDYFWSKIIASQHCIRMCHDLCRSLKLLVKATVGD